MNLDEGINVLSLFDGISCGQLALQRCGIKVNNYFASEISESAITVTQHHYPNTIQLGSVKNIKSVDLPKIDLLIGGSPCQGFSFAGKQLNFNDERSALFFEYVRLRGELNPSYYLLENNPMKKEYESVITEFMGENPIKINSALVSAQNRKRLYWTNIPNVTQPEDKCIMLKDFVGDYDGIWVRPRGFNKGGLQKYKGKAPTLLASSGYDCCFYIYKNGVKEKFTVDLYEKLQTLPCGYVSGLLKKTKAQHHIGNGWTVDVIAHIFNCLKNINNLY